MLIAAAIQMSSGPDKRVNLDKAESLIRAAAARGASFVVLPEVFNWRGPRGGEVGFAEPLSGPTSQLMMSLARELGIHLQAGSITETIEGDNRCYNTALLIAPSGECIATYRKIHLFDVEIPGQVSAHESEARKPGTECVAVKTAIGTIGLSICYDLRFPELYRRLARQGATILCIPSAFTFPTGAAHWETLVRARAIENQCYVIAPDQYGTSPNGYRDYGSSMIVDPWGAVVARASEGEGVISAEIRDDVLARVRRELPALEHARLLD